MDDVDKFVKSDSTTLPKTKPVENITKYISDPFLKCRLSFYRSVSVDCEPFLRKYQANDPLIPFLYDDLTDLYKNLLSRIIKKSVINNSIGHLTNIDTSKIDNLLETKHIVIGCEAAKLIKHLRCSEKSILEFKLECRNIIITMLKKITERSPLKYKIVKCLSSLDPKYILKHHQLAEDRFTGKKSPGTNDLCCSIDM